MSQHQALLILDFGSQFTQLIARRVRENRVYSEIHSGELSIDEIRAKNPIGVILSGGPQSVREEGAPKVDPGVFELGVPVLGICYGMQRMALDLGGSVERGEAREYGRAEVRIHEPGKLFDGLAADETVWMSHGDHVARAPEGFTICATTKNVPVVAFENAERGLYGLQFHPEVSHTLHGDAILRNFLDVCGARSDWRMASFLEETTEGIRETVKDSKVLCAISGGVDSAVVGALVKKAIGDQLTGIFVDNGLLRKDEQQQVAKRLRDGLGLNLRTIDAREIFLGALAGVSEPEQKRRIIGGKFIEVFEQSARELGETFDFLAQGTLYPDVIESSAVKGPSAVIKTHHNVGGLPERLGFKLLEPLRFLFKDEVRQLGRELGIPEDFIRRHPFPGPGLAVRILGEVTPERAAILREADAIFLEELREAGFYDRVSQAFAVFLPVKAVGVMGDERTYEHVIALRSVNSDDFMTADWSPLPHDLLGRTANRIVNEVTGINRVVYDITSKPPGTIEWE